MDWAPFAASDGPVLLFYRKEGSDVRRVVDAVGEERTTGERYGRVVHTESKRISCSDLVNTVYP